jgi:dTDP-4-dehydrorhamnose 3,5-epimerase-like enzyme
VANSPDPTIIPGGLAVDDRGQLAFVNAFAFGNIQRFYMVENFSTEVIRAFHGHLKEEKFIFVVSGSAIVAAVQFDDPARPNKASKVHRFVLSERQPQILHVPSGYANGFRPLEPRTRMIFFSTASLEASRTDDYRFPHDFWGGEIWQVESR